MLKSTFVNLSPKEEQQYGNFKKYWRILKNTVFAIYKVIFVVDRRDLDLQTNKEFNSFVMVVSIQQNTPVY